MEEQALGSGLLRHPVLQSAFNPYSSEIKSGSLNGFLVTDTIYKSSEFLSHHSTQNIFFQFYGTPVREFVLLYKNMDQTVCKPYVLELTQFHDVPLLYQCIIFSVVLYAHNCFVCFCSRKQLFLRGRSSTSACIYVILTPTPTTHTPKVTAQT